MLSWLSQNLRVGIVAVALAALVACVEVTPAPPTPTTAPPTATPRTAAPSPSPRLATVPTPLPPPTATSTASRRPRPAPVQLPSSTATPTPRPDQPAAITISRVPTTASVVALTFDAGGDRGYTAELLQILRTAHIQATFGITGRWAESNPDLLREIVVDGHELMNHTYDHRSFTGVSARPPVLDHLGRIQEIAQTEEIDRALTGVSPRPLFRPPFGDQDASVLRDVASAGYRYSILWTVDSGGWRGLPASQIVERCLQGAQPGAIYVFHVDSASHDVAALPAIIQGLRARGYHFATVGQLLHVPSNLIQG